MQTAAVLGMTLAGLGTGVGGFGIFVLRSPSPRVLDVLLGFTAGIMLAATAFSLLVPALDQGTLLQVLAGFALGCGAIVALDRWVPHVHARLPRAGAPLGRRGGRRAAGDHAPAGPHDPQPPEGDGGRRRLRGGRARAGRPARGGDRRAERARGLRGRRAAARGRRLRLRAALLGLATGLVEPVGAFASYAAFGLADGLLPLGLAFAAAAMLYVTLDELIPESMAGGCSAPPPSRSWAASRS